MINYYEVLEVSEKASKEVIEKAYKALAKKYHPDLNPDNKKEAELKMIELNEAYEVLIDDDKRANFDSVLAKKREIEKRRETYSKNSSENSNVENNNNSINNDHNVISYSNSYYTDQDDNFFVNTRNMDNKTKKKLQEKLQERYLEAYDAYLRERGYKLKYRWTFKRVMQVALVIIVSIIVFTILFFIPPIHEFCMDLYENNFVIKFIVDMVIALFNSIFSIFQ